VEPKQGVKTTEFWTAVVGAMGMAAPAVLAALADHPWVAALLGAAGLLLPAIYIWGRAILKAELAHETNVIPDAWEPFLTKALDVVEAVARALPQSKPADAATPAATDLETTHNG
jgi:hypothetical protein